VAFTDEENGGRGARCYAASVKERAGAQVAALESDAGAGHPFGLAAAVPREARDRLAPVLEALAAMGVGVVDWRSAEEHLGADIAPLQALGVPTFAPLVDTRHYFDVHHTAADTLDKVDPDALRRQVAVMAVVAYALAELPEPLPRLPAGK
jgi:hypothetical protein